MDDANDPRFWEHADQLVATSEIVIDRPRGTAHPRYPDITYPLDYGYLANTTGGDGDGIDIWRGSLPDPTVTAAIITIDLVKRDAEIKFLIGCTPDEIQLALATHQTDWQAARLVLKSSLVETILVRCPSVPIRLNRQRLITGAFMTFVMIGVYFGLTAATIMDGFVGAHGTVDLILLIFARLILLSIFVWIWIGVRQGAHTIITPEFVRQPGRIRFNRFVQIPLGDSTRVIAKRGWDDPWFRIKDRSQEIRLNLNLYDDETRRRIVSVLRYQSF